MGAGMIGVKRCHGGPSVTGRREDEVEVERDSELGERTGVFQEDC